MSLLNPKYAVFQDFFMLLLFLQWQCIHHTVYFSLSICLNIFCSLVLFFYFPIIIVLWGTMWHFHNFLYYIIVEFTPSIILLLLPFLPSRNFEKNSTHQSFRWRTEIINIQCCYWKVWNISCYFVGFWLYIYILFEFIQL